MNHIVGPFNILPKNKNVRIQKTNYYYKNELRWWTGKKLFCEHKRNRCACKECGGSQICEHKRERKACKECGGSQICEHKRIRSRCKECGGGSICEHKRVRSCCKECGGGGICEHKRVRSYCKECGGSQICEHKRERRHCKECDPIGHLTGLMRSRVWSALKAFSPNNPKKKKTMEYVHCDINHLHKHIEDQFEEGMSWKNQGEWHIDHRRPCASFKKLHTEQERYMCFHWTNLQPMWAFENMAKSDNFDEATFEYKWIDKEIGWIKK